MKAKKLTDIQQKMLIADRANGATFRELAKKYGVSPATARRIASIDNEEKAQIAGVQKAHNIESVFEYIDKQKEKVCKLIDVCLEELGNENKISKATLKDIALVLCMLIDKFARTSGKQSEEAESGVIEIPFVATESEENQADNSKS